MNVGVVLSGGSGTRFDPELPKQYWMLRGRMVISYSIDAFQKSRLTDVCIVVVASEFCEACPFPRDASLCLVPGGETRTASVKAALDHIAKVFPDCQKVIIHDAARPFLTPAIVDELFEALDEYDAVVTTKKIVDSLGSRQNWFEDREDYFLIQAPEAFRFPGIYRSFDADSPTTAGVQQLPEVSRILRYETFSNNLKITYAEDLILAESLMQFLERR